MFIVEFVCVIVFIVASTNMRKCVCFGRCYCALFIWRLAHARLSVSVYKSNVNSFAQMHVQSKMHKYTYMGTHMHMHLPSFWAGGVLAECACIPYYL